MSGIFKAYDIRGIYGQDLTEEIAYAIGKAYITFTGAKKVVLGGDCRPHSVPLQAALARGITELGADVIDIFDMKYNPLEQAPKRTDENM